MKQIGKIRLLSALLASGMLLSLAGCGDTGPSGTDVPKEKTAITFVDTGSDSLKLNNALAGLVAEAVFGYTWQETPGSTSISHEALIAGDVDIKMEEWTDNIATYWADLEAGKFTELGVNFDDNHQGFYIPRYVADAHPELKTVKDLANCPDLFPDPEDPSKGIIYGGIAGWAVTEIMEKKVQVYGLDASYNYFIPGSDAVLSAVMTSAWDKREPIVAYYWEPTWLLGMYDFVLLDDDPYDPERYRDGYGACPAMKVTVAASNAFAASNPAYCQFLSKYALTSPIISEALAYMQVNKENDYTVVARWLLKEAHPELVDQWLEPSQAEALRKVL